MRRCHRVLSDCVDRSGRRPLHWSGMLAHDGALPLPHSIGRMCKAHSSHWLPLPAAAIACTLTATSVRMIIRVV
jgi:hypothetical protein